MSTFVDRLSVIEKELQSVFEKHAARLVPKGSSSIDLAYHLVDAMRTGIEVNHEGEIIAPDKYVLSAEPNLLGDIQNPEIREKFTSILMMVTEECGLKTTSPITLKVKSQHGVTPGKIKIFAGVSSPTVTQTITSEARTKHGVEELPADYYLIVDGIRRFSLKLKVVNIGRLGDNHLVIDDPRISPRHAQLRYINGNYVIFNLASISGTSVNDVKISQKILKPGDSISLAGIPLVFMCDQEI